MSRRKQTKQPNVHGEAEEGERKQSSHNGHMTAATKGSRDAETSPNTHTTTSATSTTNDGDAAPNKATATTNSRTDSDTQASAKTPTTSSATTTKNTATKADAVITSPPRSSGEIASLVSPYKRDLRGRKRKMSDSEEATACDSNNSVSSKLTPSPTLRFRDSSFQVNTSNISSPPRKRNLTPPASYERPEELTDYSRSRSSIATALVLAAESSRRQSSRLQMAVTSPSRGGDGGGKRTSHRTCEYCGVIKPTPAALQRHIRKHTGERPFVCQVCQKAYKAKRSLLCHQLTHHPELAEAHLMNNSDLVPRRGRKKIRHLVMVAPPVVGPFSSDASSSPPEGAKSSSAVDGGFVDLDESLFNGVEDKEDTSPSASQYNGNTKHSALSKESTQDFSANVSTISADGMDLDWDESVLEASRRACNFCHKEFVKPSDLKRHLMVHTGEKPFVCQFCHKGFKQPQSLNYHLKAAHKVDIPLSQGLEERYLRLKTRAAMRDLAALDSLSAGKRAGGQEGFTSNATALYTSELSSSSFADSRPQSREMTEKESHQQLMSTIPQSLALCSSSFSPDFKQGLARQTSVASEGSWGEDRVLGPNMIEVELPMFPGIEGSEECGGGGRIPMTVQKEQIMLMKLEGVCPITRQDLQAFRCCLCQQAQATLLHAFLHLSAHLEHQGPSAVIPQGVGLECRTCHLAFTSQPEMDQHYRSQHNICLSSLDMQNNNHKVKARGGEFGRLASTYYHNHMSSSGKTALPSDDHNNNNDDHVDKEHTCSSPNPSSSSSSCSPGQDKDSYPSSGFLDSLDPSEALKYGTGKGSFRCPKCSKCYMTKFLLERHIAFHMRQDIIEVAMRNGGAMNGAHKDLLLQPPPVVPQDMHRYQQLQELDMALKAQQEEDEEEEEDRGDQDTFTQHHNSKLPHTLLEQEGVEEEVVVVIPTDPDSDYENDPSFETDVGPDELNNDELCGAEGIHFAPKRLLKPPKSEQSSSKRQKTEASPSKSRRKSSVPPRHRSALRGLDTGLAPLQSPPTSTYPGEDLQQPQLSAATSQEADPCSNTHNSPGSPKNGSVADSGSEYQTEGDKIMSGLEKNGEVNKDLEHGDDITDGLLSNDVIQDMKDSASQDVEKDEVVNREEKEDSGQDEQGKAEVQERRVSGGGPLDTPSLLQNLHSAFSAIPPALLASLYTQASNTNGAAIFSPASLAAAAVATSAAAGLYVVNQPVDRERLCKPTVMADGRTVFRCIFCHKDFLSYSDINRHMDFHEDIRPYKCNFCDYYARTNSQLKVHMMRHQGIREYCCQLCKYKGVTQSDLNRHMKSQIHLLKSQNECARCGEGFVTPKTLEKHQSTSCKVTRRKKEKQEN